jgi:hypothetical protein
MLCNQNQLARELQSLSRIEVTVGGQPTSSHDKRQFLTVCILRYGLECDLLLGTTFPTCVYRRVLHAVKHVDLKSYAQDYKTCKSAYLESLGKPQMSWQSFKRTVSGHLHYKWIMVVAEKLFYSPGAMLQWLAFDERLQTDSNDDVSDEITSYIDFEEELRTYTYDDELLYQLNQIVYDWLVDFEPSLELPRPKFGPGATAEYGRIPALTKAKQLVYDEERVRHICELFYCDTDDLMVGAPGEASYTNRIIFVPKNALKHRIISAEPTWLTWLQQAIKNPLYDYVENHPAMFTWFSDQSKSRRYAQLGSLDGSYATIDFSSASDSITVPLVRGVYANLALRELLLGTRSTMARMPDDTIVPLTKFAPMGSATCFVTMDIILLSICELSVRMTTGHHGKKNDYVVYGDDVAIRSEYTECFLSLCDRLHLKINKDKSYADPKGTRLYRESCGIECLDGVDITPVRYSRFQEPILATAPIDRKWWESTIDLMNRLLTERHYLHTRSAIVELIKYSISRGRPSRRAVSQSIWHHALRIDESDYIAGQDGPLAIVVPDNTATNFRCRYRQVNSAKDAEPAYQRPEVRCRVALAKPEDPHSYTDPASQQALYDLWFFSTRLGQGNPTVDPYEKMLEEIWAHNPSLPKYFLKADQIRKDESVVASAAGTEPDKWVWTWCSV